MLLRLLAVCLTLLTAGAAGAAEIKPFAREDMASDAIRLTETLRAEAVTIGAQAKGKTPEDLRKAAAAAAAAAKFDDAAKLAAAAVTAAPKDPANWLAFATVAIKADDAQANGRYELVTQGATAAYAAYQHATTPEAQAGALALLGDLLARHEQWRPALDALKASLDRRDSIDVRKVYEAMRAEHGFRILDYKVDNKSTSPRVCFNFSDPLARKTDFSPYVAVSGASETAISNEDQQLCVEGLKHGERYAIVLRQGLPSAVSEQLLKSADYEIYVRDRSPQAHFAGKAYVLPRQGQEGAPLVTVNTSKVGIDVFRVGDRNLLGVVNRDDFLKPIESSRADEIESQDGQKVWSGSMDVASELNKDVVTEFPVLAAVGPLQPGVYLITARPWKEKVPGSDETEIRAARDAMDGGLRSRPDGDLRRRRRPRARAVARLRRAAVGRRGEARRAQQRGAGDEDDRRRRADRFRSGPLARQRRLGAGPSGRDAWARLQFPEPCPDGVRPDRSRRRRARRAGGPRRLPLHRARRLPLGRDRVRDRAPPRREGPRQTRTAADARRQAAGRRRVQARDPGRRRARRPGLRRSAATRLGRRKMDH